MKKLLFSIYAIICYALFFASFLYLIGFVEGILVPKNINSGESPALGLAILINLGLILLFGLQHSVMARKGFKEKWTKLVPKPIERSTYVLFSTLAIILIIWAWQPIDVVLWEVSNAALSNVLMAVSFLGWGIVFLSTFQINHFDLFGLRQVYLNVVDKEEAPLEFKKPLLYRMVRHPLYMGFIVAFWFTPKMTVGHLIFALGMTIYILIGISYEERDLIHHFGEQYKQYKQSTAKLIPFLKKSRK